MCISVAHTTYIFMTYIDHTNDISPISYITHINYLSYISHMSYINNIYKLHVYTFRYFMNYPKSHVT